MLIICYNITIIGGMLLLAINLYYPNCYCYVIVNVISFVCFLDYINLFYTSELFCNYFTYFVKKEVIKIMIVSISYVI